MKEIFEELAFYKLEDGESPIYEGERVMDFHLPKAMWEELGEPDRIGLLITSEDV